MIRQHTISTLYPVGPVHCYSADIGGELVLFDTGPPSSAARDCLRREVDLARLRHVIITHGHIDHYGLAAWLEQETAATIYLPRRDILKMSLHEERLEKISALLQQFGFDEIFRDNFRRGMDKEEVFAQPPEKFLTVESDLPAHLDIKVLACPGHSQSDLVLTAADWAVTGDVLLRGIFQVPLLDIDLETGRRFENYQAYCVTLGKLATLRGRQVCPGHRNTIDSVDATILFYVGKLLQRATQLRRFSPRSSVAQVVSLLFGAGLGHPFHYYLKASELVFLRDFLACPELLRRALEEIGLFEPVAANFP